MNAASDSDDEVPGLDNLIEEITADAFGGGEQLWAFRQAFEDNVKLPTDGSVVGVPVEVSEIVYDGNERRGLAARCRRDDGTEHVVALIDLAFRAGSIGARYAAAYRKWLGSETQSRGSPVPKPRKRKQKQKAALGDIDLNGPIELVALSIVERAARCRVLGSDREITFRPRRLSSVIPGEIVTLMPRKQWSYGSSLYLSGEIESTRLDAAALGLLPLGLKDAGMWNPDKHYWGEEHELIEEWAKPIIARGPRPAFEMEQVSPGLDPDDPFSDLITQSNDLHDKGDRKQANRILMRLCQADLRCLDAHAHLGNFVFDRRPGDAIRHYEAGLRIGELSLCDGFDGLLPWGRLDNRPFLRCIHGYGLCLWRLRRLDEAERTFNRMLWLNPSDNQGARFLVEDVRAGRTWEEFQDEQQD